jgi:hypothetical protein
MKSTRLEAHLTVRATYQPYLSTTTGADPNPSHFGVLFPIPAAGDVKGGSGGEGGGEAVRGGAARHRRQSRREEELDPLSPRTSALSHLEISKFQDVNRKNN